MLNKVRGPLRTAISPYKKVKIEDLSPEQAQESCKVLKAIALVDSFKGSQ